MSCTNFLKVKRLDFQQMGLVLNFCFSLGLRSPCRITTSVSKRRPWEYDDNDDAGAPKQTRNAGAIRRTAWVFVDDITAHLSQLSFFFVFWNGQCSETLPW